MILWLSLAVFLIPLIYILDFGRRDRRARQRQLESIQRKLAAKESDGRSGRNKQDSA